MARLGGFAEDEFEVFAEAEVEHFVGFVEHHGADGAKVDRAAHDMVAQAARCGDNNMRAAFEGAAFIAHIHAADAGSDHRVRALVEPGEFAFHLKREFAGRGDDEGEGGACGRQGFSVAKYGRGDGDAEADGFARAGLGRYEQVTACEGWVGDGLLNGCQGFVSAMREGIGKSLFQGFVSCVAAIWAGQPRWAGTQGSP